MLLKFYLFTSLLLSSAQLFAAAKCETHGFSANGPGLSQLDQTLSPDLETLASDYAMALENYLRYAQDVAFFLKYEPLVELLRNDFATVEKTGFQQVVFTLKRLDAHLVPKGLNRSILNYKDELDQNLRIPTKLDGLLARGRDFLKVWDATARLAFGFYSSQENRIAKIDLELSAARSQTLLALKTQSGGSKASAIEALSRQMDAELQGLESELHDVDKTISRISDLDERKRVSEHVWQLIHKNELGGEFGDPKLSIKESILNSKDPKDRLLIFILRKVYSLLVLNNHRQALLYLAEEVSGP